MTKQIDILMMIQFGHAAVFFKWIFDHKIHTRRRAEDWGVMILCVLKNLRSKIFDSLAKLSALFWYSSLLSADNDEDDGKKKESPELRIAGFNFIYCQKFFLLLSRVPSNVCVCVLLQPGSFFWLIESVVLEIYWVRFIYIDFCVCL